jgi:hypothetical protein
MEQHLGMNCRLEMLTRVNPSNLKDLKEDLDFELRMKIDVKMKNVKMTQILCYLANILVVRIIF